MGGALAGPVTAYVYDWNMLPIGQALWLKELETYIPFPPMQDPATYNLTQVMQQVQQMKTPRRIGRRQARADARASDRGARAPQSDRVDVPSGAGDEIRSCYRSCARRSLSGRGDARRGRHRSRSRRTARRPRRRRQELAKQAQNPIANLISVPFQNNSNFNYGPRERTQNILNFQPVIPFKLTEDWNLITRTIVPIVHQPSLAKGETSDNGLGDVNPTLFFATSIAKDVLVGFGPTFTLPTSSQDSLGARKWSAGPAAVAVWTPGKWVVGGLINNQWSFAGDSDERSVNAMLLQPFVNYNIADGWYLTSSPIITADWNARESKDTWTVPVGGGVGRLFRLGKLPINASIQAFDNVETPAVRRRLDAAAAGAVPVPEVRRCRMHSPRTRCSAGAWCWPRLARALLRARRPTRCRPGTTAPAKQAIVDFVRRPPTSRAAPTSCRPRSGIATFDQDGTLWVEQPMYTQVMFASSGCRRWCKAKPELEGRGAVQDRAVGRPRGDRQAAR